jgi:hypothetical protein
VRLGAGRQVRVQPQRLLALRDDAHHSPVT